ncbi:hypothetical protein GCM10028774_03740 [Spirosoma jeollabukense]
MADLAFSTNTLKMETKEPTNDPRNQEEPELEPVHGQEDNPPLINDKATVFESGDDAETASLDSSS